MKYPLTVCLRGVDFCVTGTYLKASAGDREQPNEPEGFEIDSVCVAGDTNDLRQFLTEDTLDDLAGLAIGASK